MSHAGTTDTEKGSRGRHGSLTAKLLLAVVLAGVAITAVTSVVQVRREYRDARAAALAAFDEIEKSYLPALSLSVFNFDVDQTRLLLGGIHLLRHVSYAEVFEQRGDEYVLTDSVGKDLPSDYIAETFELEHEYEYEYEGVTRHVGELKVYADVGSIRDQVRERLGTTIAFSAIQVVVVSALMFFLVERVIVRPLRMTSRFVRSITLSDGPESSLTLRRHARPHRWQDELDEIVSSINEMKQRLSQSYFDLRESEARLLTSNEQKSVLLRELNHRTKNNMQVIMSLLSMKAARAPNNGDVQTLVSETETRIYAMALVHEKLYQSPDLSRINMKDYLDDLTRFVVDTHCEGRPAPDIATEATEANVLFDTAVPCGLIVTELVSNAIDHAFEDPSKGSITVAFAEAEDGTLRLSVSDNGRGLPDSFDARVDSNMGLRLVYSLGEQQLGGPVQVETRGGVTWTVAFRDSANGERV